MPLLVDTGVIYALADRADAWHAKVRAYFESTRDTLLAPVTILPEVAYLLRYRVNAGAELAFTASLGRGELAIEDLTRRDLKRAEQLMSTYDWLGLVDATVIAIAERLKLTTIATTDRRHFAVVRPVHVARFTLVP
jgi:predicted nucleic acid-binding protein